MIEIKQNLLSPSKYKIKSPKTMIPKYIVVHNTYNDAPAKNEVAYMINNNSSTGFHYAVDDKEIVQGIPDDRIAFHAGDGLGKGNGSGIGIEICYSKSGGTRFEDAEKLAVKLIVFLMNKYNIPLSNVIQHYDCSGKNCPHRTRQLGWDRFKQMVNQQWSKQPNVPTQKDKENTTNSDELRIVVDGKAVNVKKILKDNQNYIRLADLRLLGYIVQYDKLNDEVVISTK